MPKPLIFLTRLSRPFMGLLALKPVSKFLSREIGKHVKGPSEHDRQRGRSHLWGKVSDPAGNSVEGTLETPEGYRFTVASGLACAERVLAGEVPAGAWTPSKAFGHDFVTRLPDAKMQVPA